MKITYGRMIPALIATVIVTNGCSQQEAALANTMLNAAGGATNRATGGGSFNPASSLSSPAALSGMAQSQVVGAQMLANPALLGVGAVGTAISQYNQAQNRKAFGKVTDLYVNADRVNNKMEMMMVRQYNKKYGTHFKTMQELQSALKQGKKR